MSGLCALCFLLYRLDDRVDHLVTPGSFRRRLVSLPSDGSAPGTFDLGRLFGLLHFFGLLYLFELVHLLELVRLLGSLRSDLFAQVLGPRISRLSAFHRLTQPLTQPLNVAAAQTSYESGPDRLRSLAGREPHRHKIRGHLGAHFQARHRRPRTGPGDLSRELLHFFRWDAFSESIGNGFRGTLPLARSLYSYPVPLCTTDQIARRGELAREARGHPGNANGRNTLGEPFLHLVQDRPHGKIPPPGPGDDIEEADQLCRLDSARHAALNQARYLAFCNTGSNDLYPLGPEKRFAFRREVRSFEGPGEIGRAHV